MFSMLCDFDLGLLNIISIIWYAQNKDLFYTSTDYSYVIAKLCCFITQLQ